MKLILLLIIFYSSGFLVQAQSTLSAGEFLSIVKKHHPVARQAALGLAIARAELTQARGGFDPVFTNDIARKELGGLLYYDDQLTELKVPTWFGVDVVAGVESLSGSRSPVQDTKGASSYLGFSVPLANGLLLDKRRAGLQTAKILQSLSLQEQKGLLNDLLLDAAKAYWDWWQQQQIKDFFEQAVKNAAQRFSLVKKAFALGDRPAIDTVEALAQLQSFTVRQTEIALALANARLEAEVFLWTDNAAPYTLPQAVIPQDALAQAVMPNIVEFLQNLPQHPLLQQYRFKLETLSIDKRLKAQSLLPSVYLKYNQLTPSHQLTKNLSTPWLKNNYRYGISVVVPLRLSEGRGAYRKASLKWEQLQLEQLNKRVVLQAKLQQYYNEWSNLKQQLQLQTGVIASYEALQRAEQTRYLNGESSLFLINAREQKTLEAQQKLLELQGKEKKAAAGVLWAAGTLVNEPR